MAAQDKKTTLLVLFIIHIWLQTVETEESSEKFFGSNWPISFKKNAQTLPSIEVRLDPPEDPLPQVLAEIQLLDRARIRMEEGLMAKFEDEYNKQLDLGQTEIENAIDQAMRIFDDPNILTSTVRGALLPITNKRKAIKATEGRFVPETAFSQAMTAKMPAFPVFRQFDNNEIEMPMAATSKIVKEHKDALPDGPIDLSAIKLETLKTSFLEIKSMTKTSLSNKQQASANLIPPPTVQIQIDDIKVPDIKIKAKMDEIEQKRADEEAKMLEQAVGELAQLLKITITELQTNIQIQLNPFLVDTAAVTRKVEKELPKRGSISKLLSFREINEEGNNFINNKCLETKQKYPDFKLDCALISTNNEQAAPISFLQVAEATKADATAQFFGGGGGGRQQLNVRVGQSDKPYPTIDELFNDVQKKRDATERLERMKILQLELKFLKAMNEMIKDKLRVSLARVLAQLGPVVETIKTEIAAEQLS